MTSFAIVIRNDVDQFHLFFLSSNKMGSIPSRIAWAKTRAPREILLAWKSEISKCKCEN